MITTKQLFIQFLKQNNAYEEFMYNFEMHRVNPNECTTKEFFINTFYGDFLTHAFYWKNTMEGHNYWAILDYKWYHKIWEQKK